MPVRVIDDSDNFIIRCAPNAQAPLTPLQSLAVLISPQLRQQFSKKLFSGDVTNFDKLLAQLETAPNWRAAYRVLEHCFYRHQISPYATEATRFSDLVYKRYYPNDVYV